MPRVKKEPLFAPPPKPVDAVDTAMARAGIESPSHVGRGPAPLPPKEEAELVAVEKELAALTLARTSALLQTELDKSKEDEQRAKLEEDRRRAQTAPAAPPPKPIAFDSANRRQGERPLRPDMQRIVETITLEEEIDVVWKRLEQSLQIGERRSESGVLLEALDEAETNARVAHRLYITAQILFDEWELENGPIFGKMRDDATRSLQREKDEGTRSKQITDADIEARCAYLFEDEWRTQQMRRKKSKYTVDSLKDLVEKWSSRCKSLQTLYGKAR